MNRNSVALAKCAMKLMERRPRRGDLAMAEIFRQLEFTGGAGGQRKKIMRASSEFRRAHEEALPFERHFRLSLRPYLEGATVLDQGSFTGGRTVAWHKKYNIAKSLGIDIDPVFIDAARLHADGEGVDAEFHVSFAENLPFADSTLDAVVTFDVFEHVRNVAETMAECRRVLKKGGALIAVFPPFYCPTEHHLSCVTRTPALHWIFNRNTLYQAYREVIEERGDNWYLPEQDALADWEALHKLNGITVGKFKRIVKAQGWKVDELSTPIWPSTTRFFHKRPMRQVIARGLGFLTKIPGIREFATDRVCAILRKA